MMNDGCGYLQLNQISGLERITSDAFGNRCDALFLRFLYLSGRNKGKIVNIVSRDWPSVMVEVGKRTKEYFDDCAVELIIDLQKESIL